MAEERVQRRLAAILAADVVGYSRLMGEDEAGTLAQIKLLRSEVFDPKVEEYAGRIFKTTGDGFLIEFSSAVDAVQYAIDVQQSVRTRNRDVPEDRHIELRIGINLGDMIIDGDDVYGDGVNIAARLEGICDPCGIYVSDIVHASIRNKLNIEFVDLGEKSVKNIADPVHVFSVTIELPDAKSPKAMASDAAFRRPAVAVLPFQNMSGDPEQEYFADGLTEDIITALSSWRYFPVIARNSTFAYKGKSPDIRQVGKELGARYVIEGSVRRAGNRVRVTAQLINAETGHHVWAERFDRDLADIFDLQDEITEKIAAVISPELVKAESERSATKKPENLDAWDYCQRGKFTMNDFSNASLSTARELFEKAVERDPNLVDAWCGIAHTCQRELIAGFADNSDDAKIKFIDAARRAVSLDGSNAAAHYHLCFAYVWNRRFAEAIAEGKQALILNPIDPNTHDRLGATLVVAGYPQEAAACLEKGIDLNLQQPRVHLRRAHLARAYLDLHQYEAAADQARQTVQIGKVYLDEHLILASALGHLGRGEEAMAVLNDVEEYKDRRISEIALCPWWQLYPDSGPNEHLFDGLRKAGLED